MEFILNNVYLPLDKDEDELKLVASKMLKIDPSFIEEYQILKKSVDSRDKKNIIFVYSLLMKLKRYFSHIELNVNVRKNNLVNQIHVEKVKSKKRPIVIGFGPCGMFASLILARAGLKPLIIERGKKVEQRLKDIENFKTKGVLNLESNFCFGEGGAGTFSDGKLNTGVNDPRIRFVLNELVKFGAPEEIKIQGHPHIGSDNLVNIVKNIRKEIISLGGSFKFETTFTDFIEEDKVLKGIKVLNEGNEEIIECDDAILAIGHSARDTFVSLYNHDLIIKPKPFSIGVRIEHLQEDLAKCQYGDQYQNEKLPVSDYKQVAHLKNGRVVYTFCMCPGGEVVGTSTSLDGIVTNGMSYYKRDLTNCNAALLVNVDVDDYFVNSPLDGIYLQEIIEKRAFNNQKPFFAPCQKVEDFLLNRETTAFGKIIPSYKPGVYFKKMDDILPSFICESLREGIPLIGKKLKIFKDGDAILTGVETRSSSPISIPRDNDTLSSSIENLYPGGEGASYAGGIMSSALDGIKIALAIVNKYHEE